MAEVSVVVVTLVKPEHLAWLEAKLNAVVPVVREKDKPVSYEVLRDPAEPRRFITLEKWASKADFDAHMASDHVQGFFVEADGKIEGGDMFVMGGYL